MSNGTPTGERKKKSIPTPSKNRSSSKSYSKPEKNEKPTKLEAKTTKTRSSSKEKIEKPKKVEDKKLKTSSKSEKSEKSSVKKAKPSPPPPPPPPESEPEEQYEDDFEDYSEDFESDDSAIENSPRKTSPPQLEKTVSNEVPPPPKEEPTKFVEEEVEELPLKPPEDTPMLRRLASRAGGREPSVPQVATPPKRETTTTRIPSATERKISFGNLATVDLAALSQSERRYQKLRELITLDSTTFVILDKPPVKDYDFYMQLFGEVGKTQTSSQTRDDDVTESIQTEAPLTRSLWTQAPATTAGDWGGDDQMKREDDTMSIFRENHLENERFKRFLETASQVILDLMASRRRGGRLLDLGDRSDLAFSAGVHIIKLEPIAQKYKCTAFARNERTSQILTMAFFVEDSPADDIEGRSLVLETILDSSRPPERLFLCDGEVSSLCYTPDGSVLFAGMKDGSLSAFDLLEAELAFSSRLPWIDSPIDIVLRRPSFDTSFLASAIAADGAAPIVSIHSSATQVAVLDSSATLFLYGILREDEPRPGKTAGARLSLTLTAIVRPDSVVLRSSNQPTSLIATCMAVGEEGQFVIGTDAGFLCSMSRTRSSATAHVGPRLFRGKMQSFGEITCLRVCPSDSQVMLSGLSTGSLQLLRLDQASPLIVLTPPQSHRLPITAVEWSPTCNTGFYSWHGGRKILFWDMAIGRSPISVTELPMQVLPGASLCWLESTDERIGFVAHALVNGSVEIHALEPPKSTPMRVRSAVKKLDSA